MLPWRWPNFRMDNNDQTGRQIAFAHSLHHVASKFMNNPDTHAKKMDAKVSSVSFVEKNKICPEKPLLLELVQIVEKESRAQDQKLSNINCGKRRELEQEEQMIPDIPPAYFTYKNAK
jgi:hypothetical protein